MLRLARVWPLLFLLTGVGFLTTAPPAGAAFRLQIFDDATLVADQTSAGPAIVFAGTSTNYNIVLETGTTNRPGDPVFGATLTSTLNTTRNNTAGTHSLTILLTATDYLNPPGSELILNSTTGGSFLNSSAGGSTATFQSFADPGNIEFGMAVTTGVQTATAAGTLSDPAVFNPPDPMVQFTRSGPYSLTHRIVLTLSAGSSFAGGETTGTRGIPSQVVPAPGGLLLALAALPALAAGGLWRRWRQGRA